MKKIAVIPVLFIASLYGQTDAASSPGESLGTDIFFLDLGVVIESTTGHEKVNRLIKKPPEEVKFFIDKAPSGSVFMASTKELQETLSRISDRIEVLEAAFREEVSSLRVENDELRGMIADVLTRETMLPPSVIPSPSEADEASVDLPSAPGRGETPSPEEKVESADKVIDTRQSVESIFPDREIAGRPFDRMLYMNAVFAYQREDYRTALKHFAKVYLTGVDQITAGNVVYWIADCYYQLGEYGKALETLASIRSLLKSDKQDDAMVLTGLVYRQMGNETQAMVAFASIIDEYPDSEYLKLAQMELRRSEK